MDYNKAISVYFLYKAAKECACGTRWKLSVIRPLYHIIHKCNEIHEQLKNKIYIIKDYLVFKIKEPKERLIFSTKYTDRIVQRSLCNDYLYDAITHPLIDDNPACRKNKGTDYSLYRIKKFIRKYMTENNTIEGYAVKIDIHNYFASIPHDLLKENISKIISDVNFKQHIFSIIDSFNKAFNYKNKSSDGVYRGLGLGSQISQLLALLYLNDLDHIIKEKLKCKYYIRFMDDILVICKTKLEAEKVFNFIINYIQNVKKLTLNPKSDIHLFNNYKPLIIVKKKFIIKNQQSIKIRKLQRGISSELNRITNLCKSVSEGSLSAREMLYQINSWLGSNRHYLSKRQKKRIINHTQTAIKNYMNTKYCY